MTTRRCQRPECTGTVRKRGGNFCTATCEALTQATRFVRKDIKRTGDASTWADWVCVLDAMNDYVRARESQLATREGR